MDNKKTNDWRYAPVWVPIILIVLIIIFMVISYKQKNEIKELNRELETCLTLGEALKPCPMCGSEELSIEINDHGDYYINCEDCHTISGIHWSILDDPYTLQDAVNQWNNLPGRNKEAKDE